ncbi:MAG: polyribonucleotide nucleotidyltransferase, partial [Cyanobacteria bacterium HKST-UBA06]|nr:polyribonucleotide nucleotidyltransferase [Cyanobacteria bacterium HKST-UBA06]
MTEILTETPSAIPPAISRTLQIGEQSVTIETGQLAKLASGSCVIKTDDTVIIVTATASKEPRPGIDFFPLLVDYEEKMYAVGRLPGGFIKREGRPSEKAVLTCRLIDRPVRPLWPDGYRNDVQVVATPLSVCEHQTDVLAILGASAAITLGGLPFLGPIGAVRVGYIDNQFVMNPKHEQMADSALDLVVSGTADSIMMVEAGANFVSEDIMLQAIELAHTEIRKQVDIQLELAREAGVVKQEFVPDIDPSPVQAFVKSHCESTINEAYHNFDRDARKETLDTLKKSLKEKVAALAEGDSLKELLDSTAIDLVGETFKQVEKDIMRTMIMDENVRADGRNPEEIRPIWTKVGMWPRTHGSAIFTRGNTQVMSICTLGSPGDSQDLDGIDPLKEKRWIHHYAFPGFSVGEVKPMRGAGRREIGHGALAERAIAPSLPSKEDFPYTIRVNSEVLESNGSTSMASTCGASLALMDAGVPVSTPIGGIAMGLIKEGDQYK